MQAHLLVGPIPVTGASSGSRLSSSVDSNLFTAAPRRWTSRHRRRIHGGHRRGSLVVASSSAAAIDGDQNHYALLGLTRNATSADIKRAYRLLARKYHPDVSKHSQTAEIFKRIRHAYEVLSNEATRIQYDRALKMKDYRSRPYRGRWNYSTEFEDEIKVYKWDELRQKMHSEGYWDQYVVNESSYNSEIDEEIEENIEEKRGSFIEVIQSAFFLMFLFQTVGSQLSLTFSSLMAFLDRKLDAGYKLGYLIAWILGGRSGILLTLCLSFASWVCGKSSSSLVALVVVAMWVGSNVARYAPFPQGALLTLVYMSIKLQVDEN